MKHVGLLPFAALLLACISAKVTAWPSAIDWTEDNLEKVATIHSCTADIANFEGLSSSYPDTCHRWNLVWSMDGIITNSNDDESTPLSVTLNRQYDWVPDDGDQNGGNRLPTIKELVRLFDYKNSAGIQDPLIRKWLSLGCNEDQTNDDGILCNDVAITLRDKNSSTSFNTTKDAYLISSSYRDYDGRDNNLIQVLGVRIRDGKVVAFEPGAKGGWFKNYANRDSGMLALCEGFDAANFGWCEYDTSETDSSKIEYTLGADRAVVPIYALLVSEVPLNP